MLAMVTLREDTGKPAHGKTAIAQPLVRPVVPQMAVQDLRHAQLLCQPDDQRNAIHTLRHQFQPTGVQHARAMHVSCQNAHSRAAFCPETESMFPYFNISLLRGENSP